jgi:hypothetical protein
MLRVVFFLRFFGSLLFFPAAAVPPSTLRTITKDSL